MFSALRFLKVFWLDLRGYTLSGICVSVRIPYTCVDAYIGPIEPLPPWRLFFPLMGYSEIYFLRKIFGFNFALLHLFTLELPSSLFVLSSLLFLQHFPPFSFPTFRSFAPDDIGRYSILPGKIFLQYKHPCAFFSTKRDETSFRIWVYVRRKISSGRRLKDETT